MGKKQWKLKHIHPCQSEVADKTRNTRTELRTHGQYAILSLAGSQNNIISKRWTCQATKNPAPIFEKEVLHRTLSSSCPLLSLGPLPVQTQQARSFSHLVTANLNLSPADYFSPSPHPTLSPAEWYKKQGAHGLSTKKNRIIGQFFHEI